MYFEAFPTIQRFCAVTVKQRPPPISADALHTQESSCSHPFSSWRPIVWNYEQSTSLPWLPAEVNSLTDYTIMEISNFYRYFGRDGILRPHGLFYLDVERTSCHVLTVCQKVTAHDGGDPQVSQGAPYNATGKSEHLDRRYSRIFSVDGQSLEPPQFHVL